MKPPRYMEQVGKPKLSNDGRSAVFTFRLKKWHPLLWWDVLRYWWTQR